MCVDKIKDFAKKHGFDDVKEIGEYQDAKVFLPQFSDNKKRIIGLPQYIFYDNESISLKIDYNCEITKELFMEPNLFDFATSELSQDAFLAWFFSWADEKYQTENSALNNCAKECLNFFFKRSSIQINNIAKVDVWKQWENIDLWIVVNNEFHLIIEDKVKSKEHNNQLKKYKEVARNWYLTNSEQKNTKQDFTKHFSFIYFKTGRITESENTIIKQEKWEKITANDFQNILNLYDEKIDNDIYKSYKQHLDTLIVEDADISELEYSQIFRSDSIQVNKKLCAILKENLYKDAVIEKCTKRLKWYKCGIPKLGCIYFVIDKLILTLELQIFNMDTNETNEKLQALYERITEYFTEVNLSIQNKTKNFLRIGEIKKELWLMENDGKIDLNKTIDNLHLYEKKLWEDVLGNEHWEG